MASEVPGQPNIWREGTRDKDPDALVGISGAGACLHEAAKFAWAPQQRSPEYNALMDKLRYRHPSFAERADVLARLPELEKRENGAGPRRRPLGGAKKKRKRKESQKGLSDVVASPGLHTAVISDVSHGSLFILVLSFCAIVSAVTCSVLVALEEFFFLEQLGDDCIAARHFLRFPACPLCLQPLVWSLLGVRLPLCPNGYLQDGPPCVQYGNEFFRVMLDCTREKLVGLGGILAFENHGSHRFAASMVTSLFCVTLWTLCCSSQHSMRHGSRCQHWPRCLLWRGWLLFLTSRSVNPPWAVSVLTQLILIWRLLQGPFQLSLVESGIRAWNRRLFGTRPVSFLDSPISGRTVAGIRILTRSLVSQLLVLVCMLSRGSSMTGPGVMVRT